MKPGDEGCWNVIGVHGDGTCPELVKVLHCRSCPVFGAAGRALFDRESPEGYREEWAEVLSRPVQEEVARTRSALIFRLNREWFAIETALCVEVTDIARPRRVPHRTSEILLGLVNIRGQIELCVSLGVVLNVASDVRRAATGRERLIVIEREQERWVFAADEVHGVQRYADVDLGTVPATLKGDASALTRGVLTWDDRHVIVLDGASVCAALRRSVA